MSPPAGLMGTLGFKDLRIECIIGVHPHERETPQPLTVSVSIDTDFASAADSDDVENTIDYDRVVALVSQLAQEKRYRLLEALAADASELILSTFAEASRVEIEIEKPAALPEARCSFVRLSRERER